MRKSSGDFISKVVDFSGKINNNKIVGSIQEAFIVLNPFIILASIATLFSSLICSPKAGLATVEGFQFLVKYNSLFSNIYYGCLNTIALLLAYNMAQGMAKRYDVDPHFGGILGLVSYICMSENSFEVLGSKGIIATGLSQDVTGSTGMFYAMVIAVFTILLYSKLAKVKKFEIKLPGAVPANVGRAFSSLTPTCLTIFILCAVRFGFFAFTQSELSTLIYTILQKPLGFIVQTPFGFLGIAFCTAFFWVLGLHGTALTSSITKPLFLAALTTNIDLVNSGLQPTAIVTKQFNVIFGGIGGFGCTLGLIIAILLVGKRADEKAIAKLALPAGLFQINEPIIFGLPIVLNPIYAIPFVIAPLLGEAIGYLATKIGIMPITYIDVPWVTPPFINAFLATGGKIQAVFVQLFVFVVIVALFIPFVKMSNRVYLKKLENSSQEESEQELYNEYK